VPDVVDNFEVSSDGLTYTFTIKDNVRFHPPLDRLMTAEDVVFSFDRFFGRAGGVGGDFPSQNTPRLAVIDTVTAPDASTVVITLKNRNVALPLLLADVDLIVILPVEAADSIDLSQTMVGTGPWILEEYRPSVGATYRRNDQWHMGPDLPYFDTVGASIVPETATRVSQFLAGNLDEVDAQGEDVIRVVSEMSDVQLFQKPATSLSLIGFQGRDPSVPWMDERVRQAVSVALDRESLLEAAYDVSTLKNAGIPVTTAWHTQIPAGFAGWWVDPQGSDMDPEVARFYQYDPDYARELLAEAGYADGFSALLQVAAENYGRAYDTMAELIVQYLGQVGINLTLNVNDYSSVFVPEVAQGNFDGLLFIPANRTSPQDYLTTLFAASSTRNYLRLNLEGGLQDPELTSRYTEILEANSLERQQELLRDFQNYASRPMYFVPMVHGAGPAYLAYQPNVGNALDYQSIAQTGAPSEALPYYYKTA
jgi:ABC-type transport system substrate-binding protein